MAGLPTIARCSMTDKDITDTTTGVTSLPDLPQYPRPLEECARPWGEDPSIVAYDTHRARRSHFNSCHPIPDVCTKYDGFKFPKAMDKDVSVFHSHAHSTVRHVYRPPRPAVFPINNPTRTQPDGKYFLTDNTRAALANSVNQLYCTPRNMGIYRDTTDHIVARQQRDDQYHVACGDEEEEPTCCRILNHPDPCPFCWNGGTNKHFIENLRQFQAMLPDINKQPCSGDPKLPCSRCYDRRCPHKHHCRPVPAAPPNKPQDDTAQHSSSQDNPCITGATNGNTDNAFLDTGPQKGSAVRPQQNPSEDPCQGDGSHNEGFGPWTYEHRLGEPDEQYLLPNVYKYKMPAVLHCSNTQNEHNVPHAVRHNPDTYNQAPVEDTLQHWTSRCREESRLPPSYALGPSKGIMPTIGAGPGAQIPSYATSCPPRNTWTYRDGNNLRVPCVSNVIGSRQKTDAHTRFFQEYPESVPDLRDWARYSKRVNFCGYNSSVFR